jgi:hypothetical protein
MATTESAGQAAGNVAAPPATPAEQQPGQSSAPAAAPSAQPERGNREPDRTPRNRLRSYSAALITLLAAMGAIATWRAEVAATKAAELNQRGVVIAINLGAQQTQDRAQAMGEAADVTRVQQLLDERDMLYEELSLTPAGPAHAQLKTESSVASWVAEWQLRNDWPDNYYLSNARTAPSYDIAGRTAGLVAESRIPTDSATFFTQANNQQASRRKFLFLDIALVIGLACATVAHQLVRRGRLQVFCAASGTTILVLGIIGFVMVEV